MKTSIIILFSCILIQWIGLQLRGIANKRPGSFRIALQQPHEPCIGVSVYGIEHLPMIGSYTASHDFYL